MPIATITQNQEAAINWFVETLYANRLKEEQKTGETWAHENEAQCKSEMREVALAARDQEARIAQIEKGYKTYLGVDQESRAPSR